MCREREMGNCFPLSRPTIASCNHKILRVVKTKSRIVEQRSPIVVKDLLVKFDGYDVGVRQKASRNLLPKKCYKLHSASGSVDGTTVAGPAGSGEFKRIKVVITKHQLQELLSKSMSVDEMISEIGKGDGAARSWLPKLETIPEGDE